MKFEAFGRTVEKPSPPVVERKVFERKPGERFTATIERADEGIRHLSLKGPEHQPSQEVTMAREWLWK